MEIEGFNLIMSTLILAKNLHDIGRFDIVEANFYDDLSYDSYYEGIMSVLSNIFNNYDCIYDEDNETELMLFMDDIISNYFVMAWEYGRFNKISHDQNPYVIKAHDEVRKWLNIGYCTSFKLLAYTKTKRTAKKSMLLVQIYNGCGCNAPETIAYGLIQLYKFFYEEAKGMTIPTDLLKTDQLSLNNYGEELLVS